MHVLPNVNTVRGFNMKKLILILGANGNIEK